MKPNLSLQKLTQPKVNMDSKLSLKPDKCGELTRASSHSRAITAKKSR